MHVRGIEDDPISMWKALKEVHMQQKPTARFNAYEALFNITKSNDESLPAVAARVEKAMHTIKDLRPSEFTLDELDDDLAVKDDVQLVLYLFYFIAMGTVVTVHRL